MQMLLNILEIDYNLRKESCNYYLEVKQISDINFATNDGYLLNCIFSKLSNITQKKATQNLSPITHSHGQV